jgi:dipeptidase D
MHEIEKLEPAAVWSHFYALSQIPRCSKNEGRSIEYVRATAERSGLEFREDRAGNIVVLKKGSPGREKESPIALQAHLDMVCEKDGSSSHRFDQDPLSLFIKDDRVYATGTTLGADNGIGAAYMLALASEAHSTPPLELLFTVDEEAGMTGAFELDEGLLTAQRLINLDTEEEDCLCIGCSGGGEAHIDFPIGERGTADSPHYRLSVSGLKGGHSGFNIHLGRGNAIQILGRALYGALDRGHLRIASISGGNKMNAIPREAVCEFSTAMPESELNAMVDAMRESCREVYRRSGEEIRLDLEVIEPAPVLSPEASAALIRMITALPCGMIAMSRDLVDTVETSTNVGIIRTEPDRIHIVNLTRSFLDVEMDMVRNRIGAVSELAGAICLKSGEYPAWKMNRTSPLLKRAEAVYERHLGRMPRIIAVHAGLETGIFGKKFPGIDMISMGPDIFYPHSPGEHVSIQSVQRVWRILLEILEGV